MKILATKKIERKFTLNMKQQRHFYREEVTVDQRSRDLNRTVFCTRD